MSSYGSGLVGLPNAIGAIGGAIGGQAVTAEAQQLPRVLREIETLRKSIVVLHHTIESFEKSLAPMTRPQTAVENAKNDPTPPLPPTSPVVIGILRADEMVNELRRRLENLRESLDV